MRLMKLMLMDDTNLCCSSVNVLSCEHSLQILTTCRIVYDARQYACGRSGRAGTWGAYNWVGVSFYISGLPATCDAPAAYSHPAIA